MCCKGGELGVSGILDDMTGFNPFPLVQCVHPCRIVTHLLSLGMSPAALITLLSPLGEEGQGPTPTAAGHSQQQAQAQQAGSAATCTLAAVDEKGAGDAAGASAQQQSQPQQQQARKGRGNSGASSAAASRDSSGTAPSVSAAAGTSGAAGAGTGASAAAASNEAAGSATAGPAAAGSLVSIPGLPGVMAPALNVGQQSAAGGAACSSGTTTTTSSQGGTARDAVASLGTSLGSSTLDAQVSTPVVGLLGCSALGPVGEPVGSGSAGHASPVDAHAAAAVAAAARGCNSISAALQPGGRGQGQAQAKQTCTAAEAAQAFALRRSMDGVRGASPFGRQTSLSQPQQQLPGARISRNGMQGLAHVVAPPAGSACAGSVARASSGSVTAAAVAADNLSRGSSLDLMPGFGAEAGPAGSNAGATVPAPGQPSAAQRPPVPRSTLQYPRPRGRQPSSSSSLDVHCFPAATSASPPVAAVFPHLLSTSVAPLGVTSTPPTSASQLLVGSHQLAAAAFLLGPEGSQGNLVDPDTAFGSHTGGAVAEEEGGLEEEEELCSALPDCGDISLALEMSDDDDEPVPTPAMAGAATAGAVTAGDAITAGSTSAPVCIPSIGAGAAEATVATVAAAAAVPVASQAANTTVAWDVPSCMPPIASSVGPAAGSGGGIAGASGSAASAMHRLSQLGNSTSGSPFQPGSVNGFASMLGLGGTSPMLSQLGSSAVVAAGQGQSQGSASAGSISVGSATAPMVSVVGFAAPQAGSAHGAAAAATCVTAAAAASGPLSNRPSDAGREQLAMKPGLPAGAVGTGAVAAARSSLAAAGLYNTGGHNSNCGGMGGGAHSGSYMAMGVGPTSFDPLVSTSFESLRGEFAGGRCTFVQAPGVAGGSPPHAMLNPGSFHQSHVRAHAHVRAHGQRNSMGAAPNMSRSSYEAGLGGAHTKRNSRSKEQLQQQQQGQQYGTWSGPKDGCSGGAPPPLVLPDCL